MGATTTIRSPSRSPGRRRNSRVPYRTSNMTRSSAGGTMPSSSSQNGVRDPRPLASTTRSAGMGSPPASRTTVTRSRSTSRPVATLSGSTCTPGSAVIRRRTCPSSIGRLASSPVMPLSTLACRCPQWMCRASRCTSLLIAPCATNSAVIPFRRGGRAGSYHCGSAVPLGDAAAGVSGSGRAGVRRSGRRGRSVTRAGMVGRCRVALGPSGGGERARLRRHCPGIQVIHTVSGTGRRRALTQGKFPRQRGCLR